MVSAGVGHGLPFLDDGIALAHAALGRLDEARDGLIAAAQEHASRFVWAQTMTLVHLANVERLRGDHAAAQAAAEQALAVAECIGHRGLVARARHQLARVTAAHGEWPPPSAWRMRPSQSRPSAATSSTFPIPSTSWPRSRPDCRDQEAARLLGAAHSARAQLGLARWQTEQERTEALTSGCVTRSATMR